MSTFREDGALALEWVASYLEGVREQLRPDLRIHVAAAEVKFWEAPDFSHTDMPPGFPDALRAAAKRFTQEYRSHLRTFEDEHEVADAVASPAGHVDGDAASAPPRSPERGRASTRRARVC